MSKKIISILLSVLMVASMVSILGASAFAASADDLTYEVIDGKATITGCALTVDGTLVIPETIGGYTVNAIGEYAFAGCVALDAISIPETVETIGEGAFDSCVSLAYVDVLTKTADLTSSLLGYSCYDVYDGMKEQFVAAYFDYLDAFMIYEESGYDVDYEADVYAAYIEMLNYAEENEEYVAVEDFAIFGFDGSTAEAYAADNGFAFYELVNEDPTPEVPSANPDTEVDTDADNTTTDSPLNVDFSGIGEALSELFSSFNLSKIVAIILKIFTMLTSF
ncbi:MAG: leucine-rich repeat protein [Clostridia bacterium]|nr:leucine-rich repeat protein [Clostridia bacterium]